jgi:hypothetical protein
MREIFKKAKNKHSLTSATIFIITSTTRNIATTKLRTLTQISLPIPQEQPKPLLHMRRHLMWTSGFSVALQNVDVKSLIKLQTSKDAQVGGVSL